MDLQYMQCIVNRSYVQNQHCSLHAPSQLAISGFVSRGTLVQMPVTKLMWISGPLVRQCPPHACRVRACEPCLTGGREVWPAVDSIVV